MSGPLKLKAKDAEDVQVISAVLQDAIAPVCDMTWDPAQKNFIMVVHRLRREDGDACAERICCALNLRGAQTVQTHGIDLAHKEQILDLLAIMPEGQSIQFVFAGDAKIRVALDNWDIRIEDFGESWPASCKPCHDAAQS